MPKDYYTDVTKASDEVSSENCPHIAQGQSLQWGEQNYGQNVGNNRPNEKANKRNAEMLATIQTRSLEMRSGRTLYLKALGTFHALPKRK